jgi:hypothetical protein
MLPFRIKSNLASSSSAHFLVGLRKSFMKLSGDCGPHFGKHHFTALGLAARALSYVKTMVREAVCMVKVA